MEYEQIGERVAAVRERIADAARRSGRPPESVRLVAATKTRTVDEIASVIRAGVFDVGENRAQELVAKAPALVGLDPVWHFIGRLQRNKINQLRRWVSWWQSIDDAALADALTARVEHARVLIEVNIAGETQKGGCTPEAAEGLTDRLRAAGADVRGLMTVAPASADPRPTFAALRGLAGKLELAELSMGMSGDFEAAIEEGATIVRVGTGLFGPRPDIPPNSGPGAVT
ncbi:MAG: YggS family pyridoxal phosphate-dependent enzyme [Acidimicrobiia bacterium]|nr:YggS family pyridoxal phosphate-dependent enzyme [Acidimicrobiia bacterium]